jgi:hypothetical protein
MTVTLKDVDDRALWSIELEPKTLIAQRKFPLCPAITDLRDGVSATTVKTLKPLSPLSPLARARSCLSTSLE